ncbi:hypothetical protein EVAR_32186_1 [Eumeta japonica]|uniref:Uncharacterized protein n=1 Tax=Eumeta variegata TaxID=151549 RepID=A0A4C1VYD8_EUMVA|nr:hypothetical protein EVAR_32186_1 [Eumeta japonica]
MGARYFRGVIDASPTSWVGIGSLVNEGMMKKWGNGGKSGPAILAPAGRNVRVETVTTSLYSVQDLTGRARLFPTAESNTARLYLSKPERDIAATIGRAGGRRGRTQCRRGAPAVRGPDAFNNAVAPRRCTATAISLVRKTSSKVEVTACRANRCSKPVNYTSLRRRPAERQRVTASLIKMENAITDLEERHNHARAERKVCNTQKPVASTYISEQQGGVTGALPTHRLGIGHLMERIDEGVESVGPAAAHPGHPLKWPASGIQINSEP